MTGSSDARGLDTASYTLTVSGDPRFRAIVHALAQKTAETAGCTPDEATRLADAVRALMDTVVRAVASPAAPDIMQVRFNVDTEAVRVELTCDTPAGMRAGWSLERGLAEEGRLDAFRALVPDAEFVVTGHHHRCRFSCFPTRRS
jgi:hypothetical protein